MRWYKKMKLKMLVYLLVPLVWIFFHLRQIYIAASVSAGHCEFCLLGMGLYRMDRGGMV